MIVIRDGGLTSTNIHTQDTPDGHIPFHNVLGSVAVTGGSISLLRETAPLGSVSISGGTVNITPPAVQAVQFGLSSATMGQRTMSQSIPVTLASDQPSITVTATLSGGGSVVILGGSVGIVAGTALMGSVNIAGPITALPGDAQVAVGGLQAIQIIPVGFGLSSATMGQKTMSQSVPVTLASDQPSITVTASLSGGGSVNVLGGSVQLIPPALVTPVQFGLSSASLGQKTMSASIPVTLASDQPTINVTATVEAAGSVNVLGGSISLIRENNPLGSVGVTGGTVALLRETSVLGSVNISGGTIQIAAGAASMGSVNIGAQPVRVRNVGRTYIPVSRLASNFGLGSTGALGDYLSHVNVIVTQAANSQVTLTDSGVEGGSMIIFPNAPGPGIGTYTVPWDAVSRHGQYRLSLSSGVDAVAVGDFT